MATHYDTIIKLIDNTQVWNTTKTATNTKPIKQNEIIIIKNLINTQVNSMHDEDYYNTLFAEEQGIKKWEREKKNQILAIRDQRRKQQEWNKLFPVMTLDDSFLNSKDLIF